MTDPRLQRAPWRDRLYETIFEHHTLAGKVFDVALILVILVSVLAVMLESVRPIGDEHGPFLRGAELAFTGLFTIEYGLRLASHPHPKVYARSFFGVIDLFSILPTYTALLFPGAQTFVVLRIIRITRVFRVLKLVRFVREGDVLGRALVASVPKVIVFIVSVICLTTICGSLMYAIEGPGSEFTSIPRGIYWAIVTLTTVGFGDVTPHSTVGQVLASVIMILGYGIIAVPTGIVTAELARQPQTALSGRKCSGCGHEGHDRDATHCKRCGSELSPLAK